MSKANKNFFKEKKPWSIAKDDLLRCYIRPYMAKMFHTKKPIVYIDCFAGAGYFGSMEGVESIEITQDKVPTNYGSPLIALKEIKRASCDSNHSRPLYREFFIEKEYYENLAMVIANSQFKDEPYKVLKGDFK